MEILKKMAQKAQANAAHEGVTVAFLGDSVTQGCFEIYKKLDGNIETVFDKRHAYSQAFADMLSLLYPSVPVNILNAGISGDNAPGGLKRLERDVLRHEPDLVIVCYGLNDCGETVDAIARYTTALAEIFAKIKAAGCELIFMTPNMMNTGISPFLMQDEDVVAIAETTARKQTGGVFDAHIEAAKALCREMDVPVCDCYALWKQLYANGVETTELLSNRINHPTREMNRIFAYELIKTMFTE